MKPYVTMLMISSVDGRLHPSRWTESPDGDLRDWGAQYEAAHASLDCDGWIVGRVTMAEMTKAGPHPTADVVEVVRPVHVADLAATSFAIAVDPSGRLHLSGATVAGEHAIVLLGGAVPDAHLAELAADGVSYIVSPTGTLDLRSMLETLHACFGVERLALEGGGIVNGHFLAAGLVDEVMVLIAPALDGEIGAEGIIGFASGLAGKVRLGLLSATPRPHGVVELRYRVAGSA